MYRLGAHPCISTSHGFCSKVIADQLRDTGDD